MLGLSLSALLLAAPADTSAPAGDVRVEARSIVRVWLLGPTLDQDALSAAVAARLADKQILRAGQAAAPIDGLAALCHVTSPDASTLQLEVILSDGRLYQRTIAAPREGSERAAARLIAATLAAIEDASATPDRRDGVFAPPVTPAPAAPLIPVPRIAPPSVAADGIPPWPEPPPPDPRTISSQSHAGPSPAHSTRSDHATPGLARSDRAPPPESHSDEAPRALSSRSSTRDEPRELGVALELGPGFGLGTPAAGRGLAAGGGGLRVDLRLRRGVTLGAGFRGHARLQEDLALGRFRWALGVGHTLRRRALELALLAGPTLETWQVTQRGAAVAYTRSSSSGASLLLGGLARAALGGRWQRRRMSARFGGYLELAGSARASGRAAQIAVNTSQGGVTPVFVLGGAELSAGVEVELWFMLQRRR